MRPFPPLPTPFQFRVCVDGDRKQAALKSGKSGIQQQLDALKTKIEREQADLKAKRGKISYRSTDEIDREIKYYSRLLLP